MPRTKTIDINNTLARNVRIMQDAGRGRQEILDMASDMAKMKYNRMLADGTYFKYTCTCDNIGPRFGEDSNNGCCPGCFQWALENHQEMDVNGVEPVTMEMIEGATWGFNVAKIKENKAIEIHERIHRSYQPFIEVQPEDFKGLPTTDGWVNPYVCCDDFSYDEECECPDCRQHYALKNKPADGSNVNLNWSFQDWHPGENDEN